MDMSLNVFSEERVRHVGEMRSRFFATGSEEGITGVRPEILESWKACYHAGLKLTDTEKPFISEAELEMRIQQNKVLLEVTLPYTQMLSRMIGENFATALLDSSGVVLNTIGSANLVAELRECGFAPGSDRNLDRTAHINLYALCVRECKPCQLIATEHCFAIDDKWAGVAAPIFGSDGKSLAGVITVNGYWWFAHPHTLGLVVMMAESIQQHLFLKHTNQELEQANKRLATATESFDTGIVYFSNAGYIRHINSKARHYLGVTGVGEVRHDTENIYPILRRKVDVDALKDSLSKNGTYECEFPLEKGSHTILATFRRLMGQNQASGTECFAHLRLSSDVHKMANQIVGSRAMFTFDSILGKSPALMMAKKNAELAAEHSSTVLLRGESGTGKEVFAQAIHNGSPRANGPFIALNCGAIPKSLIESELFGYEPGAFTGAQRKGQAGKFELADGGTLFLDEIGDMPYELQVTLLRVLQNREVTRVGGSKAKKIDISVIAATNQDLTQKIENKMFRSDLYFRLNVISIDLPPLRARNDDMLFMAQFFLEKYCATFRKEICGFTPEATRCMAGYHWPGNIRELENIIERAIIVCQSETIGLTDLPEKLTKGSQPVIEPVEQQTVLVGATAPDHAVEMNRQRVIEALKRNNGNLTKTAADLGMSRPTLYRKLNLYGIRAKLHQYEW